MSSPQTRKFSVRASRISSGGFRITLPFDPSAAWGPRGRYHVTGTIDGTGFRTTLVRRAGAWEAAFGPKSQSSAHVQDEQVVAGEMWPEGPQAEALAPDIASALAAQPEAQAAFDGLATFYRKGWLRWIDATKRRPDVRADPIAEMVRLVKAGHKERP